MSLLMQGVVLMVIGMATVFAFLVLMVAAMNASAAFFRKFEDRFADVPETASAPSPAGRDGGLEKVAVALAAIRAKRG